MQWTSSGRNRCREPSPGTAAEGIEKVGYGAGVEGIARLLHATCFIAFHVTCIAVTRWFYYRRGAETPC